MKLRRRTLSLLMSVVVLTLLASVSIAGPGGFGAPGRTDDAETTTEESADPCAETTDVVDPTDLVDCLDDDTADDDGFTDPDPDSDPEAADRDPEREAACMEAAGIERSDGETTKPRGLDNAIEHVLANCMKNPQAPGLLEALQRLAMNRERHEAHAAWKAERKAERDAAKAARKSGKDAGARGNSSKGGHGNPHDGDSGSSHGNGHST